MIFSIACLRKNIILCEICILSDVGNSNIFMRKSKEMCCSRLYDKAYKDDSEEVFICVGLRR